MIDLCEKEIADAINKTLLEPLEEYRLSETLNKMPLEVNFLKCQNGVFEVHF